MNASKYCRKSIAQQKTVNLRTSKIARILGQLIIWRYIGLSPFVARIHHKLRI